MLGCLNETERGLIHCADIVIAFALVYEFMRLYGLAKRADTKTRSS